jgi:hypothetical protein
VKQYFYGVPTVELTPFSQTVPFTDVIVRRAVEGSITPSSALPHASKLPTTYMIMGTLTWMDNILV